MYTEEDFEEFGRFIGYAARARAPRHHIFARSFAEHCGLFSNGGEAGLWDEYGIAFGANGEEIPNVLEAAFALWLGLCD